MCAETHSRQWWGGTRSPKLILTFWLKILQRGTAASLIRCLGEKTESKTLHRSDQSPSMIWIFPPTSMAPKIQSSSVQTWAAAI